MKFAISVEKQKVIAILILFVYLVFYLVNIRALVGFFSPDEQYFLSATDSDYSGYQFRYLIWSYYQNGLIFVNNNFPFLINIFITCLLLKKIARTNAVSSFYYLMFIMPTVVLYHFTYLRDVFLMQISIVIMICLAKGDFKIKNFLIVIAILVLFVLRPIYAVVVLVSLMLSGAKFKIKYLLLLFFASFILVPLLMFASDYYLAIYIDKVILFEKSSVFFGLYGFDQSDISYWDAYFTFIMNWIPFWFTYHPFKIDSMMKVLLMVETGVVLLVVSFAIMRSRCFVYTRFNKYCLWLLLLSMPISTLESGPATSLRHKLFFLPALFYLAFYSSRNSKNMITKTRINSGI